MSDDGDCCYPIRDKSIPPTPLTREQVFLNAIKALQCLYIAVDEFVAKDVNEKVTLLIESYRNDLAQQAQEVERLQKSYDADMKHWTEQLAASQQRVEAFQAGQEEIASALGWANVHPYTKQTFILNQIAHLQATLAARDLVIQQQEATIRGYRHSVDIMGRNHDDRKAERNAARQDAARLRIVIKTILFQVAQGKVLERDACISEAKRVYEDTKPT